MNESLLNAVLLAYLGTPRSVDILEILRILFKTDSE